MKTVLCFFVLILITAILAETPKEKLKKYSDECKSESGVSDEVLERARNGEDVDDPNLKKHGLCILKKAQFINDSGKLQIETIKSKFKKASNNHEGVDALVTRCAVERESVQATSDHFFKCIHEGKEKAAAH